jgi:cysteinyl-tRNA synthetase
MALSLYLYNYFGRKKQKFIPLSKKRVGLYTCGPTVYDRAHIGNLRTYVFEDVLKRTLEYNGYKVKHVMNITDVDDKIIKRMKKEKKSLNQITTRYLQLFLRDIKKLNIKKADYFPRATKNIKEMIGLIAVLLKKGVAYKGEDGSVYFNLSKFKKYGRLSGLEKQALKRGTKLTEDEYSKKAAGDFVLWKKAKPHEPSWGARFGKGRPGWHIECSAMSMKYLGKTFDIHAGAVDLIFPHHENEIAQSESVTGQKFVNYFVEGEHLLVNGKKMAKSLKNFYTLKDIEKRKIKPLAFRYLVLNSHYRSPLNFTWHALKSSQQALNNLKKLAFKKYFKKNERTRGREKFYKTEFKKALNDDLNTPKALNLLWRLVHDLKTSQASKHFLIKEFDQVLGLKIKVDYKIPKNLKTIVAKRNKLRQEKRWKEADDLRKKADKLGWIIEDTPLGPAVRKKL